MDLFSFCNLELEVLPKLEIFKSGICKARLLFSFGFTNLNELSLMEIYRREMVQLERMLYLKILFLVGNRFTCFINLF